METSSSKLKKTMIFALGIVVLADQASGIGEVNIAIGQMDQMTQQNAAIAEESTAASVGLFDKADVLAQQIGRFRTAAGTTSSHSSSKVMRRTA